MTTNRWDGSAFSHDMILSFSAVEKYAYGSVHPGKEMNTRQQAESDSDGSVGASLKTIRAPCSR